jgi:AcrR family transcriptional regulator
MYKVFVQTFNRGMSTGTASAPRKTAGKPVAVVAATRPDRRLAILLAAERLFAQHGYHAVSIRQIAEAAGVPLALVGYYFGPKHELFHAIFEHWQGTVEERLERLDRRCTPRSRRAAWNGWWRPSCGRCWPSAPARRASTTRSWWRASWASRRPRPRAC